jgi:hypothetical protein
VKQFEKSLHHGGHGGRREGTEFRLWDIWFAFPNCHSQSAAAMYTGGIIHW